MGFFHVLGSGEVSLRPAQQPVAAPVAPAPAAAAPVAPAPPAPGTEPTTPRGGGVINLAKGERIDLAKSDTIRATVSWPPATDYDVYALVRYRDGRELVVSTFGTRGHPRRFATQTPDGAVRHLGDVRRSSETLATESLEIRLTPEIAAVVPVVYSAQSNGSGSFRRYRVSMRVDNGAGQTVVIDAAHASDDDQVFTCVPGIIRNEPTGTQVEAIELYSRRRSERRPTIDGAMRVLMDTGAVNAYK